MIHLTTALLYACLKSKSTELIVTSLETGAFPGGFPRTLKAFLYIAVQNMLLQMKSLSFYGTMALAETLKMFIVFRPRELDDLQVLYSVFLRVSESHCYYARVS